MAQPTSNPGFEATIQPQLDKIAALQTSPNATPGQSNFLFETQIEAMIAVTEHYKFQSGEKRAGRAIGAFIFEAMNAGDDEARARTVRTVEMLRTDLTEDKVHGRKWHGMVGKYATKYALSAYDAQHAGPDHPLLKAYGIKYDGRGENPDRAPEPPQESFETVYHGELVEAARRRLSAGPFRRALRSITRR